MTKKYHIKRLQGKKFFTVQSVKTVNSYANILQNIPCISGYAAIKTAYHRLQNRPSFTKTATANLSWLSALTITHLCPAGKGNSASSGNAEFAIVHIVTQTASRISQKRKNKINKMLKPVIVCLLVLNKHTMTYVDSVKRKDTYDDSRSNRIHRARRSRCRGLW